MKLMLRIFLIVSAMILVDNPFIYVAGGALIFIAGIAAFAEGMKQ